VYTLYKVTNLLNGKYYVGVHKTNNPNDSYYGSGLRIKRAIRKYGKINFSKQIIDIFESEKDAYKAEIMYIGECEHDSNCYNIDGGGKGGFTRINKMIREHPDLYPNPMKIDKYKIKSKETTKRNETPERRERKIKVSMKNLQKALLKNTGKKRPEHAEKMALFFKEKWKNNKEKMRDSLSGEYELVSPYGEIIVTNRLKDLCVKLNLPFVSIWVNTRSKNPISKGRAKNWKCKKILKS
jgi:hypothetical protein